MTDVKLSRLATNLITSFVYSNDVVSRLSLGSVRDLRNAALWLCEAEEGKHRNGKNGEKLQQDGWSAVTSRAQRWKEARGNTDGSTGESNEDMDWLVAVRKTLEANMHDREMYPPGRVLWAMRDSDLHPSHQRSESEPAQRGDKDKLRLFEVLDVEKVFDQIVFARNMLTCVVFFFLSGALVFNGMATGHIYLINTTEFCMTYCRLYFFRYPSDLSHHIHKGSISIIP